MIDPVDLKPFSADKLKIGGTFYLKNPDGSFSTCKITEDDMKHHPIMMKVMTERYAKEKRLYVRYNRPWGDFV